MSALHLTLTIATYPEGDRWTWTLHAGRHIVSTSGGQLFTRRIDCARGAEVGAGLEGVRESIRGHEFEGSSPAPAVRYTSTGPHPVTVRVLDARAGSEPTC